MAVPWQPFWRFAVASHGVQQDKASFGGTPWSGFYIAFKGKFLGWHVNNRLYMGLVLVKGAG